MSYSMIHAVAGAEDELRRGSGLRPDEHSPLQMRRNLDAGERKHGRRQVDEADELVAHGSGRQRRTEAFRPADHERNAQAGVVERPLRTRHAVAVIAPVEHDRVLGQAVVCELLENLADLAVHVGDVVVHARELFPHRRRVGIVRRHLDFRRIGDERLPFARGTGRKNLALVRDLEVEHREERLASCRAGCASARRGRRRPRS